MKPSSNVGSFLIVGALAACGGDKIISPPVPSQIEIVSGDNQTATQGSSLALPIEVAVTTATGGPVANATVNWKVTAGGGTLSASTSTTNNAGRATVNWTLGAAAGTQTLEAVTIIPGEIGAGAVLSTAATATATRVIALHYDGTKWSISLQAIGCCDALSAIWGASPTAVFAGGGGCSEGSFVIRYDGSAWGPLPGCTGAWLNQTRTVSGTSSADVFAAKRSGDPMEMSTLVVHYDGQSWTTSYSRHCSLCNVEVQGLWSQSPADVFAVGDGGLILRYDGTSWTTQSSGTSAGLKAVWGDPSSGGVFAVGDAGTILHFDGVAWSAQASATTQTLFAIWGTSGSNVFAAGANGVILHYDGASWSAMNSGTTNTLRALWGNSGSSVFVVGYASTILHYDGVSWTAQSANLPVPMSLNGIWGSSPSNIFAVGGT